MRLHVTVHGDARQPLSYNEESAWIESRLAPAVFARRTNRVVADLPPDAGAAVVRRVADELVRRHAILRTAYPTVRGRPHRVVIDGYTHEIGDESAPPALPPAELRPCDLVRVWQSEGPPRRMGIDLSEMITDPWSCARLQREMAVLVEECASGGRAPATGEPPATYADFAGEQRRHVASEASAALREYWLAQLAGAAAPAYAVPDGPDPSGDVAGERICFLDDELVGRLRAVGARHRVSSFMTVIALLEMALAAMSGARDIALTTVAAGRTARWADVQGNFKNTVLLRTVLPERPAFADVADAVRRTVTGGLAHRELPHLVVRELLAREAAGRGAEPVMDDPPVRVGYLTSRGHHLTSLDARDSGEDRTRGTDFTARPIDVGLVEDGRGRTALWLNYDTTRYTHAFLRRLVEGMWAALRMVEAEPGTTCDELRVEVGGLPAAVPGTPAPSGAGYPAPRGAGCDAPPPPRGGRVQAMAEVWAKVLGVPEVGLHDDLFLLGGGIMTVFEIADAAARAGLPVDPARLLAGRTVASVLTPEVSPAGA